MKMKLGLMQLFSLLILTVFIAPAELRAGPTNTIPISVVVRFDNAKPKYEVDSKSVRSDKLLEVLGELKKEKGERDAQIVVIVDHRNSLAALSNMRGIVDKAGFFNARYFCFNPETGRMSETTFDQPAVPFSLNPAPPTKRP